MVVLLLVVVGREQSELEELRKEFKVIIMHVCVCVCVCLSSARVCASLCASVHACACDQACLASGLVLMCCTPLVWREHSVRRNSGSSLWVCLQALAEWAG